jgi:3'-phosphoadenosine 5'-phosphosulfate sulfotransferase (PAPS reductase)/FAD synthetase
MKKKYLVTFSGGKDSLAIILWAKANLVFDQWDVVFCDTGHEAKITYEYIDWIEKQIGKKFIRLKTNVFEDKLDQEVIDKIVEIFGERNVFAEMVMYKGRFPSTKARFCTEELKMKPMIDYVLSLEEDVVIVQGVRAEESEARAMLLPEDEYFRFYFEPKKKDKNGNAVYDKYRKDDVICWCDKWTADTIRPILRNTHGEVFNMIFASGLKPNPLYFKGHSRVGCYPCIMCRLEEIRLIAINEPERIEKLYRLEMLSGSTFFPPFYIPEKYCSKKALVRVYQEDLFRLFTTKKQKREGKKHEAGMFTAGSKVSIEEMNGTLYEKYFKSGAVEVLTDEDGEEYFFREMKVPTIKDVVAYVTDNPNQTTMFDLVPGCVSVYNICEA